MNNEAFYRAAAVELFEAKDAHLALRRFGKGPAIVLIHGFPTHGYTWRHILPELSKHFTCYVFDLPGLGYSEWNDNTDFTSNAQASRVMQVLDQLAVSRYAVMAHDSGATVARIMALENTDKVSHLISFNTEVPGHRPPWIVEYQTLGSLPGAVSIFQYLLKKQWFISSRLGFKEFYSNKQLLKDKINIEPYAKALFMSAEKMKGAIKYLQGIDWKAIDMFKDLHQKIKAKTLLLWGENDKTFPIEYGQQMVPQFNGNCKLISIPNASLLPHEEQPDLVNQHLLAFLKMD